MSKEILMVAEAVSNEKGVSEDIIFEAIELALATATAKRYDEEADIQVVIDRESGDYVTKRRWLVMPDTEISPARNAIHHRGSSGSECVTANWRLPRGNGRKRRVWTYCRADGETSDRQRVRDAERAQIADEYRSREGELLGGTVKKVTRDNIIVDLGNNAEGLLPRGELVGRETFRINDRVRAI